MTNGPAASRFVFPSLLLLIVLPLGTWRQDDSILIEELLQFSQGWGEH